MTAGILCFVVIQDLFKTKVLRVIAGVAGCLQRKGRKRDYNNAEVKLAKDLVAMYVMRDDNPRYCDTHCMSAPGKEPHTEIYIVPRAEYPNWLMEKANIPDDGMPLTDQIPERYSLGF